MTKKGTKVRRLSKEEIKRIRQLYRLGFGTSAIAKAKGIDAPTVIYHTSDIDKDGRLTLPEFIKSILPHLPDAGPPFPKVFARLAGATETRAIRRLTLNERKAVCSKGGVNM